MSTHKMGELRKYRVISGTHYERNEDGSLGEGKGPGEIVFLREKQFPPLANKLEPYNSAMAPAAQQAELASIPDAPKPLDEGADEDSE